MKYTATEKMEIIRLVEGSPLSIRKTLEEMDVSRSTFYEWYKRYKEGGFDGLKNNIKNAKQIPGLP
jgi:transposase